MITLLRLLVLISLLAMLAVAMLPFDRPHVSTIPIDEPRTLPFLLVLIGLLAVAFLTLSAYGLLRFRPWAPKLAAATAVLIGGLSTLLLLVPSLATTVTPIAKAMAFLSAIALMLAVAIARRRILKEHIRVAL